jgi:predicted PolB exonuclease-like 3'-5' exonuclease
MKIEEEIQEVIDGFVESLEEKEDVLVSFNAKVQEIISQSKHKFELETDNLDKAIDEAKISEQEYRQGFLQLKNQIAEETKQALELLVQGLEQ